MKEITMSMIKEFRLKEFNIDFMGYSLQKHDIYTFHHLIVPNRNGGPYARWNGAILCGKTAHPYLHTIEAIDYDMFAYITSELIDMNVAGKLSIVNLQNIKDILLQFEREHSGECFKKGRVIIKEEYTKRANLSKLIM